MDAGSPGHIGSRAASATRRNVLAVVLCALVLGGALAVFVIAPVNAVVAENRKAGSDAWIIGQHGFRVADDKAQQIKGYASDISVNVGESLDFHVTVSPAGNYHVDTYRIGWYGGAGGRLVAQSGPLPGSPQPVCPTDAVTGLIACRWSVGYTLAVPPDWVSGIYLGVLTNTAGYQNYVFFVVRDDARPAALLYQASVNTYQAYSDYPNDGATGKGLYWQNSFGANTVAGTAGAVKVSFDRPFANGGSGSFLDHEVNFVRWLERMGYDAVYSTDVDTSLHPERLLDHRAFISVGHAEYWSEAMVDGVITARDHGVNVGFFSGNTMYWQVRLEDGGRTLVCYRVAALDPVSGPTTTVLWRDPPVNRPEQLVMGNESGNEPVAADYVVRRSRSWVYAGTGLRDGDVIPGIVGYETDTVMRGVDRPLHRSFAVLARSPVVDGHGNSGDADTVIYQAPSGAWVFSAGSIWWSWGLDDYRRNHADQRLQRMTQNILDRFVAPP